MFKIITIKELIEILENYDHKSLHVHHTWKPNHTLWKANPDGLYWQKSMQTYHKSLGWRDIGQHVTLLPDGKFVTGRDFSLNPASISGKNEGAFACEMLGNFDIGNDVLEGKQKASILALARYFDSKGKYIRFHNENSSKTCPGTSIVKAEFMQEVRDKTIDKVKDFQTRYNLSVDGIIGAQTKAKAEEVKKVVDYIINYKKPDKETYIYSLINGTRVIKIDTLNLTSIKTKATALELAKIYPNFISGMFYDPPTDILFRWLIVDGKVISSRPWYDLHSRGTFIIYNDGKVEIKTLKDIPNPQDIKLAFQGFNLDFEANGSKNLVASIKKEGLLSDVSRPNTRPAIGYNPIENKVVIVIKNTDADGIRAELRAQGCIDNKRNTLGIGLDSGGSTVFYMNSKPIINTTREQRNILIFN